MELSAVARKSKEDLLPICQSEDIAGIAFSTTGRGILTGKYGSKTQFEPGDIRNMDPLFQRARFQSALVIKEQFVELSKKYDKTSVQMAIAWVLAKSKIICALTGSSKIKHLEENLGGSGWTISGADLDYLDRFLEQEDALLVEEEKAQINQILSSQLASSPAQAFIDLVYVLETSHDLNLLSEKEIRSLFQELWPLREALDESSRPKMIAVQKKLSKMVNLG